MCEKCGHLPKSGYIEVGGYCVPKEQLINYKPPEPEVDDNGVLTKRAILELVESLPVRNILSGSSYAEGAFMKLAQLAIEGYKAWLREKVKKLPIDIDSYTDICINLQAVLALLEKKP